ncbi:cytochrome P450 [Nocardioides sp. AN3]
MTTASDTLRLPPVVPMSLPARLRALRDFHTGPAVVRDLAGPVVRVPIGSRRLVPTFVVVTSPQGAHDVLAGSSNDIMDKLTTVHRETRLVGDNLFNLPYQAWKPQRRTLQPLFTKQHVATFAGHMAAAADERASRWFDGARIDLDRDMRDLTLRVLGRSLFGVDLDEHASDLGPSIERVLRYITARGLRPVRAPKSLPTPARRRFRGALADIHAVVEAAIAACEADPDSDSELVRLLLAAHDPETGRALTHDEVVSDLAVFLIAGHDTTSTTLTYALWALGHHPELQDRVAEEVGALGDRALTVDDVPALPFTVQVIHEALRLCPPAAALARLAMRDTVVDGFRIERGTNLLVGIYALHRDPALWEAPETFDPDRFSAERARGRDRWQFLPFGAGSRSCIGDHFAMLEATLGLASVVRRHRVTSLDPDFPLALPFTMTAGGPIPVRVDKRG